MLQRVSISDSTASFFFRNVSPNVAACVHLWFYSIILLQKCFAQCCSVCPSLILLHHSTSEMFRPMLQRVPISDSTPSFYFRNVSPNVAACAHLWFYSIILLQKCFAQCCSVCPSLILLHHSTSEIFCPILLFVQCCSVYPYLCFYSIILFQKCFAQCYSMCPSLILLHHSSSEMFRPMLQHVPISDSTASFYFRNVSPNVAACAHLWFYCIILLQKCFAQCCSVCPSLILLHHSTSEMFRPMLQRVSIPDSTPSFFLRNVSPNVAACVHLGFYSLILLQNCFAQCCSVCPSLILLHHSSSEMFRPMLRRVPISDSTLLFFFRTVSPNVAACAHLWFYSLILLQNCFAQCCSVCPSLILLSHSTSEMFRPMLQRVPISDSTLSFFFRTVSPNVAACVHLWFYCIILLQKCFAQCCSVCPSLILLSHSSSELFRPMLRRVSISDSTPSFYLRNFSPNINVRPMLQRVSISLLLLDHSISEMFRPMLQHVPISDSTPSFFFRNVTPNVAACAHLWFYCIILLQKCFAQCCSVSPSLILLHHSTSEMFRPMLQRVSISDSTPSFYFRNVSPNVAACAHPWFYCIILIQNCFAQCCSVCPSLILLHHSNSELFRPMLQRVSISDSTASF